MIVAVFVTALAGALSYKRSDKTDASTLQASPVTGILAILMGLFPFGFGLYALLVSFPALMKPKPASPTPTDHDIVRFILIICAVMAGVYFLAAANTLYRPQIAWRLHLALAIPWIPFEFGLLIFMLTSFSGNNQTKSEPLDWRGLLLMSPILIAPFHSFFAFRDTWRVFRARR